MIYDAIRNFNQQFEYEPKIENGALPPFSKFVVVGMGGSHLAADLLKAWKPNLDAIIHCDYGLPAISDLKDRLIIVNSYSGNTEEVIDAFGAARKKNLSLVTISIGGKLLELAQKNNIPYIQMPDIGIQPRSALGFNFRALLKIMGEEDALAETKNLAADLKPAGFEQKGKALAEKLKGFVPVIYTSGRNASIAYNWKVKFNETGKIPAFYNVFPELNHNEMTGFDAADSTKNLSKNFYFLFFKDKEDEPRIIKRMEMTKKLYQDRGLPIETIELEGKNIFYKIFASLVLADWISYYLAQIYGVEAEQVPMVEEFKKMIV